MLSRPIEKHGSNCIIFPNCLLVKMPKECLKFHHLAKASKLEPFFGFALVSGAWLEGRIWTSVEVGYATYKYTYCISCHDHSISNYHASVENDPIAG